MPTLRELAAESIGRITRRGLEPQIAQIGDALAADEQVLAVVPGKDGTGGVVVVVSDRRLLWSAGAAFAKPALDAINVADVQSADAGPEGDVWALHVRHAGGQLTVGGMFDRDAQRVAALLDAGAGVSASAQPTSR